MHSLLEAQDPEDTGHINVKQAAAVFLELYAAMSHYDHLVDAFTTLMNDPLETIYDDVLVPQPVLKRAMLEGDNKLEMEVALPLLRLAPTLANAQGEPTDLCDVSAFVSRVCHMLHAV
jgi:hypothetical protein